MQVHGVCYDVGRVMLGQDWRPDFAAVDVEREIAIIREDLHCNAIRICGQDLDRLAPAADIALRQGLEVWLSPELWDASQASTLTYIEEAARRAEELRARHPGKVVLSVGSELTLFMQGLVPGDNVLARLQHPSFWETVRSGGHNGPLNAFLAEAAASARRVYHGPLTYASVPLEGVAWEAFDVVSVDLYREARIRDAYPSLLHRFMVHGRPLVVTEFGCCTYRGAAAVGGQGWAIVNPATVPPTWQGSFVRDEAEQARELTDVLTIMGDEGVRGAFVMTFVAPTLPTSDDPRFDLDMASYSLVKSYRDRKGTTYPGLPWDPKAAFAAVARYYADHPAEP